MENLDPLVSMGGELLVHSWGTEPDKLHPFLQRHAEPLEPPPVYPARPPPQLEFELVDERI